MSTNNFSHFNHFEQEYLIIFLKRLVCYDYVQPILPIVWCD
jgi:hypothetical protein